MNNPGQNDLNAVIQRGYTVDIGGYIGRGWAIFQENIGGFIGFLIVSGLINYGLGFVPVVGSLVALVIGGPLQAGNYIVAFKLGKRQPVEFGDFFKGFQNTYFVHIFLATLIISMLGSLCFVPAGVVIFLATAAVNVSGSSGSEVLPVIGPLGILLIIVGVVAAIFLSVVYLFSIPLIVGQRMEFWPAMEASRKILSKQWFGIFIFLVVLGLINIVGVIPCGLGLLVTVPLTTCSVAAAYESIVGLPTFDPSQA